ncbi:MAG TPA: hypothetical protein VF062_24540 [Candidatus Limnocylindrales bacterium]
MRKRLLIGVTATVLATTAVVPGAARPAQATVDPSTVAAIIQFAVSAFQSFKGSQNGGLTLEQATVRIISAINLSRDAINAHADELAMADATACVRHHVLEFADIAAFPLSIKQRWAQDVTACVTLIDALWNAVLENNYTAKNQLGILLGAVGPIALIARAQARFSTVELTNLLVNAFTRVKNAFAPPYCTGTPYFINEEFWLYHYEPVLLSGGIFCSGPWDITTRTNIGTVGAGGYFWFQGGNLLNHDFGPLEQQYLRENAAGVAIAALAQLQS